MKRLYFSIYFILFTFLQLLAQSGFTLKSVERVDIPFEYKNNLIIVSATFQGVLPLKFIFDTGAEHTIISKKEITDLLNIPYRREFKLIGSDMSTEISAFLISGIQLQIADLLLPNRSMLVLEKDVLSIEEVAGIQVHGILGADIFKRYIVQFDYQKKIVSLYSLGAFKMPKKGPDFDTLDIEIYKNKPYLKENIWLNSRDSLAVKLIIDSGAALAVLLHTNTDSLLQVPDNAVLGKLAFGLGGFIEGYLGRSRRLQLGKFQLYDVLTNFQDLNTNLDTSFLNGRNGLIGNQALNRFDIIIDYPREKLYLRPNKSYRKIFEFDKSGLIIIATGLALNQFIIHDVLDSSPAEAAGLKKGDTIKSINRISTKFLSLKIITDILKKKEGKRIRMVVKREGKRQVYYFKLQTIL